MKPFPIIPANKSHRTATPLVPIAAADFPAWLKKQPDVELRRWLTAIGFTAARGQHTLLPVPNGGIDRVLCGVEEKLTPWSIAHLPEKLPEGVYALEGKFSPEQATQLALGWALACYRFTKYKKSDKKFATLVASKGCDLEYVQSMAESICWARDLINTPANDMNPATLAAEAVDWAKSAGAQVTVIKGEALLKANYPTVYTVGKASAVPPHFVDIRFPRKGAPKITLVGKGVCFDSGGLDIKPTNAMKLMKKDMGGAANVLALARTLVETGVKVQLRVLLPIVENAVSGNAMRPLDIVKTRKGITVEIGNTDAEGRLILCDALADADEDEPDLLVDCATLTGAARVALGTEVPAFFTDDEKLAQKFSTHSQKQHDPVWRLPLWKPYRAQLDTPNADLSNDPDSSYGGAITAALYLQEFVSKTSAWLHIDMMAWNLKTQPGRPQGGEAMAIRALYSLIKEYV